LNDETLDPTMGPCPACSTPLDGARTCAICGHTVRDPRIGTVLAAKYRLDDVLGEGGMGIVYRATHLELGEHVAVKFLKANWATRTEFRARFRREAVILAKLRHPGIVTVLDFGELDGDLYMAMELVHGTALSDLITPGGPPLSRLRVFGLFDQLLAVLEAAHDEGIVHRDLKPENVMLVPTKDGEERVKVLDFGIAFLDDGGHAGNRLTETGTVRGTPQYMSPEQCKGVDVTAAADVYAVGVMLFEALAGVLPFEAVEVTGIMIQHMFVEPPLLRDAGRKPDVARGLELLVKRALSKKPEERPDARTFRQELASIARGTDVASFEDRGAQERTRMAALSRSDRALTGVASASEGDAHIAEDAPTHVIVWASEADGRAVRTALAVHGLKADVHTGDAPPARTDTTKVLVVSGGAGAAEARVKAAKDGKFSRLPVLVVHAASPQETVQLVRVGASDVALASASDDEIVKKLRRILRRGR